MILKYCFIKNKHNRVKSHFFAGSFVAICALSCLITTSYSSQVVCSIRAVVTKHFFVKKPFYVYIQGKDYESTGQYSTPGPGGKQLLRHHDRDHLKLPLVEDLFLQECSCHQELAHHLFDQPSSALLQSQLY